MHLLESVLIKDSELSLFETVRLLDNALIRQYVC